jgi:hypothetical protein
MNEDTPITNAEIIICSDGTAAVPVEVARKLERQHIWMESEREHIDACEEAKARNRPAMPSFAQQYEQAVGKVEEAAFNCGSYRLERGAEAEYCALLDKLQEAKRELKALVRTVTKEI